RGRAAALCASDVTQQVHDGIENTDEHRSISHEPSRRKGSIGEVWRHEAYSFENSGPKKCAAPQGLGMRSAANAPDAVIFIGIQASGKSTFYAQRFAETHAHVNLDTLRTRTKEAVLLRDCIARKQSFVVDNTNAAVTDRARYIVPAHEAGFRVVAYLFEATLQD